MRALITLLISLLTTSAWAQPPIPPQSKLTAQQVKQLRGLILKRQNKKAAAWLDANVRGLWCDNLELPKMKESKARALQADIGVLARRLKRWDDAMSCLTYALEREPAKARAAALYEAYLVIQKLSPAQHATWAQKWQSDETDDYPDFDDPKDHCPALEATLQSQISCEVLWRARKLDPKRAQKVHARLLRWAYGLAPLPQYARGTQPPSPPKALQVETFEPLPSTKGALRALILQTAFPSKKQRSKSSRPRTLTKKKLPGGTLALIQAEVGSADGDFEACNRRPFALLQWKASAGTHVLPLGLLHEGDNCYVGASEGSAKLRVLDAKRGIVRVRVTQQERVVGSHHDPEYSVDRQRTYQCDLSSPKPTCLVHHMKNHMGSKRLYSHAPEPRVTKAGTIKLKKRAGDYHDPRYDALQGKTLEQATKLLAPPPAGKK